MLEETRDTITVPATLMIRMLASLNTIRRGKGSFLFNKKHLEVIGFLAGNIGPDIVQRAAARRAARMEEAAAEEQNEEDNDENQEED